MDAINWLDKGLDWFIYLLGVSVAFVYNWLNKKIDKLDERMNTSEKSLLENKLENTKIFVTRYDLEKIELKIDKFDNKIDKLADSLSDLKEKLLTKS